MTSAETKLAKYDRWKAKKSYSDRIAMLYWRYSHQHFQGFQHLSLDLYPASTGRTRREQTRGRVENPWRMFTGCSQRRM